MVQVNGIRKGQIKEEGYEVISFFYPAFVLQVKLPGQWDENPDRLLLQWAGVNPTYGDQFKAEMGPDSKS